MQNTTVFTKFKNHPSKAVFIKKKKKAVFINKKHFDILIQWNI